MRQAHDRTTAYAKLICSGLKVPFGESEYLACKRHLDDMARKDFAYIFDAAEAEKHIDFAEELTLGEGTKPQKLVLDGWQAFIIGNIFGWRVKYSKEHRFREAYIQVGRQNGKDMLAGSFANDFATLSGYQYGLICCTATKQDQAKIAWKELLKFIRSDKDLEKLYKVQESDVIITSLVTGTEIKAIGRDTKSADGFRPILAIIDEYHAHRTNQMYNLMHDGQINVTNALTLVITTAGFNLNGPCYKLYKLCKRILTGAVKKETQFVFIAEMDEKDDIWDQHNWAKANPHYLWNQDNSINTYMLARLAQSAITAREIGGEDLVNFKTKHLNTWVKYSNGRLLDIGAWERCGTSWTLDQIITRLGARQCYLGLDLSQGGDLTSIVLEFPLVPANLSDDIREKWCGPDSVFKDGLPKIYVWSHSYMPELALPAHEQSDLAPYRAWVNQKLLTVTSGMYGVKTDYDLIFTELKELKDKYDLEFIGVGYDPANASAFLSKLEELAGGADITSITQSAKSLNDATQDIVLAVKAQEIFYDQANELLTWSAVNAMTVKNGYAEIKIDKNAYEERIDPICAMVDAHKLYFMNKEPDDDKADDDAYDTFSDIVNGLKKE